MVATDWIISAKNAKFFVKNFVNGDTIDCHGTELIRKFSPRDGSLLYTFGKGTKEVVDHAVACSREAFDDRRWSGLPVHQRKQVLQNLADLIEANKENFALYECLDVGKPISQALMDVSLAANILRECAEGVDKISASSAADGLNYQVRKPLGVVAAIIGWNFPLVLAAQKVGPALVMGNSLVLKPSEFSPLSSGLLVSLAMEAGVPAGVFNVVQGAGSTVGTTLAHHPNVNLLTFTGSSVTGKQMLLAAGQSNMKRLMLECGGKSPYIVFNDCPMNLDFIAQDIVGTAFRNQGQLCIAGTRVLIQESLKAQLLPKIQACTARLKPGDPLDPSTTFGPLINKTQLDKVLAYIDSGIKEGAQLIQGGKTITIDTDNSDNQGYYLEPTIFDQVKPQYKIAREEIFGPVLSIFTFKEEDEAIHMANDTCFGLAAYVATENLSRAKRLSQQLNAGLILIIGSSTPTSHFISLGLEGHRESGFGHEGGLAGLLQYTVSSSVHLLI